MRFSITSRFSKRKNASEPNVESKIVAEQNLIYAKKGVFSEKSSNLKFKMYDLGNTKNVLLSFLSHHLSCCQQ